MQPFNLNCNHAIQVFALKESEKKNAWYIFITRRQEKMVFTVTSSNRKVKIARFYEFLFTLGWR